MTPVSVLMMYFRASRSKLLFISTYFLQFLRALSHLHYFGVLRNPYSTGFRKKLVRLCLRFSEDEWVFPHLISLSKICKISLICAFFSIEILGTFYFEYVSFCVLVAKNQNFVFFRF